MPFSATVDKRTAGGSPADVAVGATAHVGARSGGDGVAEQTEGSGERTENRGTEGGRGPSKSGGGFTVARKEAVGRRGMGAVPRRRR